MFAKKTSKNQAIAAAVLKISGTQPSDSHY